MMLRKNGEWSVTCSCPGRLGKRGIKLEKERMKRERAGRERKLEKTEGKKHDRKSGHLQDRDRVTSQPFIKEESRFHS